MDENFEIELHCFFCKSTQFILPDEDYQPTSGEQIQCANCGRTNDYDSLMRVAKKKANKIADEYFQKIVDKEMKKINKLFR